MNKSTFDQIINPDAIKWDDGHNHIFNDNYTPRHMKETKMSKLLPIFGTLFRTFLLLGTILFILWVPYALGEIILPLLP